jgi:hypothetical protein
MNMHERKVMRDTRVMRDVVCSEQHDDETLTKKLIILIILRLVRTKKGDRKEMIELNKERKRRRIRKDFMLKIADRDLESLRYKMPSPLAKH